jgi:hypothetical protein
MIDPKKDQPQSWQEILRVISRCPVCGSVYNTQKAKLFAQHEEANMVHFSCDSCEGNFIAMVMTLNHGLSTVGLVSDLDFEDARRKFSFPSITVDEVISYHQQIINNNFLNS